MKLPLEGRWLGLAALVAVAFVGILALAVRFVSLPASLPQKPPTTAPRSGGKGIGIAPVGGAGTNAFLREQSLLDPDPLFLPTEFNASQVQLPALVRREPGVTFQPVAAKYAYTLTAAPITFPEVIPVPARPVDSFNFGRVQSPYEVMGRFDREEPALPVRVALIEVVQAKTGRVVFTAPINASEVLLQVANADWRPLELMAAVDSTGLIGQPALTRSSGVEAIDVFFRSYLAKQFHLGERLPPGFYSLRVGP